MTLKDELANAQTRIEELETAAGSHDSAIAAKDEEIKTLGDLNAELDGKLTSATAKVEELTGQIAALEGDKTKLTTDLATANSEITTLKANDKNADEKAREIAARNGSNLPPKAPGAGDQTTDGNKSAGLTGMAKARAYFADRQPKQA